MSDNRTAGDGGDEFDPDRNAEQIVELRDISHDATEYVSRLLAGAVVLSVPYLLIDIDGRKIGEDTDG